MVEGPYRAVGPCWVPFSAAPCRPSQSRSYNWRRDAERNAAFVEAFAGLPEPLFDRRVTSTDRLRIWRVTHLVRR